MDMEHTASNGNGNEGNILGPEWSNEIVVIGCMDEESTNYNPDATYNNNECLSHNGPTWHVNTSGDDINGDGSLEHPFASIQRGLDVAASNDTVLVASGTYNENIEWPYLTSGIKLLGEGIDNSIIDGGGNGSVIIINTWIDGGTASQIDSSTHISGFTIQNGATLNGQYAGGIYLTWAGPTLTDLDIRDITSWGSFYSPDSS